MPDNFLSLTKTFITALKRKRITTVAGAWVYYFLLSFVPLVFLIVTAFNLFGVDIASEIVSRLPEEFRLAGETIREAAERASRGVTVFFSVTVVFSVSTLLKQMSKDGDYIYGCKAVNKRGIFRRLWAIVALVVLFAVFLLCAVIVAFWNTFFSFLSRRSVLATAIGFTALIIFSYIVILFLHKFICPTKLCFQDSLLGGLASLAIIVLGTIGFIIYLRFFSNYNAFYGSLSTVVVFMLWAYILMLGLSVGAVVNTLAVKSTRRCKKSLDNSMGV